MTYTIIQGDCIEQMRKMPDNSVDSIITDPPYELGFMGKSWDATGIAYNVKMWKECLRVLKHGGHLLSFGGSRTYHRMASAIEDAGFEIRDQIMWIYSTGLPKSLNIGKQIDKRSRRDYVLAAKELGLLPKDAHRSFIDWTEEEHAPSDKYWEEFKRLIPMEDWQKIERQVIGKGQAGFLEKNNVFELQEEGYGTYDLTAPATPQAKQWDGWGTALKPAHEPIVVARKPLIGTVAENVLKYGTGGMNIDGCRIETDDEISNHSRGRDSAVSKGIYGDSSEQQTHQTDGQKLGRFPANIIFDEEAGQMLDEQSGIKMSKGHFPKNNTQGSSIFNTNKLTQQERFLDNLGGASRFFYCAKASKSERNIGLDGHNEAIVSDGRAERKNIHPTVKPIKLMEYLVKLVTPPNGTVLDPFTGSGSTGCAAVKQGFNFLGIEKEEQYVRIAEARISVNVPMQESLI